MLMSNIVTPGTRRGICHLLFTPYYQTEQEQRDAYHEHLDQMIRHKSLYDYADHGDRIQKQHDYELVLTYNGSVFQYHPYLKQHEQCGVYVKHKNTVHTVILQFLIDIEYKRMDHVNDKRRRIYDDRCVPYGTYFLIPFKFMPHPYI